MHGAASPGAIALPGQFEMVLSSLRPTLPNIPDSVESACSNLVNQVLEIKTYQGSPSCPLDLIQVHRLSFRYPCL